ncbi:TPA: hypothetical protein ACQGVI_005746 [Pseudomonas aeruginosa]
MTKANERTCPSGDGSLRHPCPAHPAPVEQAGGDERAAFFKHLIGRHPAHETEIVRVVEHNYAAWKAWRARAALAQPSLMPPDRGPWHAVKWDGGRRVDLSSDDFEHDVALTVSGDFVEGDKFRYAQELAAWMNAHLAQPSPARAEQAEAERPEVVARVVHSNPFVLDHCGPLNANDELMTVAQHAASVARWAEMFNRVEQQRDVAQARVAELERGKVYVEARRCDECQHDGINDSATGVAACHECDWTGPEPEEDKCPGCQRENCMAAACPQCGARYVLVASEEIAAPVAQAQQLHDLDKQCRDDVARALGLRPSQERGFAWSYLLASIKSCVKASEDAAQAQHSVPAYVSYTTRPAESLAGIALRQLKDESRWVEIRDINAHAFPDMQSHSYYPAGTVIKLPAAAPGKEVPQAWLDVQAERRRQVEVEGYHGFRDSHYISYELSKAARAYIEVSWHALSGGLPCKQPESWPWMAGFKWSDGRTMLVKACALTLAEIERLDRAAAPC